MNSRPTLSIAMCTCDGEAFLDEQLNSLLEQTRPPDEVIVCDDASQDATPRLLDRFVTRAPFPVELVRRDRRIGARENFGDAFRRCGGDWIFPADQDDRWHPDKLERFEQVIGTADEAGLIVCDLNLIDEAGRSLGRTQWESLGFGRRAQRRFGAGGAFERLLRFNVVTGVGMAFAASLRRLVLPIPDGWVHDEWVALLAAATRPVRLIEEPLVDYRRHAQQQIGPAIGGWREQWRIARRDMGQPYFQRMLERTHAARERLEACPSSSLAPDRLRLLTERERHAAARLQMRQTGQWRLPTVLREWGAGRYRRFGYGWKSALQDLFLP